MRHHAGVDAGFDARLGLAGEAQQLDAVAELAGEGDVQRRDAADAFHVDGAEIHRAAEGEGGEDGELVGGVDAVHVEGGVGFGVAELLGVGQHFGEFAAALAHHGEDVVAGAVEDAGDAGDAVAGEALAQGLDDRDAAGHGGFEPKGHARLLGGGGDGGTVDGKQGLVGGDDRLAVGDGGFHQGAGGAFGAADDFHHHVHPGVGGQGHRVFIPAQAGERHAAVAVAVAGGHGGDGDGPAGAGGDEVGVLAQHGDHAAANGAEAGDADRKRAGHAANSRRKGKEGRGIRDSGLRQT